MMVELSSRSAAGFSQKEFQGRFDDYGISHSERALNDYCLYASNCLADKIDKSLEFLADMILRFDISEEAFPAVKSLFLQEIQSKKMKRCKKL